MIVQRRRVIVGFPFPCCLRTAPEHHKAMPTYARFSNGLSDPPHKGISAAGTKPSGPTDKFTWWKECAKNRTSVERLSS